MAPDVREPLYWSIRGAIACERHAPSRDDARWAGEKWKPLVAPGRRIGYRCQYCYGTAIDIGNTTPARATLPRSG